MTDITLSGDQHFSLDQTLGCGQVFRWDHTDDGWWYGVVGKKVIRIRQSGTLLRFEGAPESFITNYFSLDIDLLPVLSSIDQDPFIHSAISRCKGLRLIRQPKWECLVSYIISTNSNIPMIRRRIATIAQQFGKEITFEDKTYYTFPDPLTISCSGEQVLTDCKLGYRTPYVLDTACEITDAKRWEDTITALPFEEGRLELMKLKVKNKRLYSSFCLPEIRGVPGRCLDSPDNAAELYEKPGHHIRTYRLGVRYNSSFCKKPFWQVLRLCTGIPLCGEERGKFRVNLITPYPDCENRSVKSLLFPGHDYHDGNYRLNLPPGPLAAASITLMDFVTRSCIISKYYGL
jgi:N-glycosylase/DNA lyase